MSTTELVMLGLYLLYAGHTYFILAPRAMKKVRAAMDGSIPPLHPVHVSIVLLMYGTPLRRILTSVFFPVVTLAFLLWVIYLLVKRKKRKPGYWTGKEM